MTTPNQGPTASTEDAADTSTSPAEPQPGDPEPAVDADHAGHDRPPGDTADAAPADHADDESAEDESAEGRHKHRSFWRELPVLVVVALVLAYLIKTFLVQAFYIPSESMEDTLLVGDRVLVSKLAYRFGEVERGDVVVFDGRGSFDRREQDDGGNPIGNAFRAIFASFGLAPGTESDYIKRVIGVGGDHVVCCDRNGSITVNGVALEPEDYLYPGDEPSVSEFDVVVPEGRIWVMGDHRSRSQDSRSHTGGPGGGTVSVDRVIGRAFVKVWPIGRWDTMPRPEVFEQIPDAEPTG